MRIRHTHEDEGARDRPKIVMVDDDDDFRCMIEGWLSPRFDVTGLSSGEGLLDQLEAIDADLVILDVRMPGPDGFKLCRRIRSYSRHAGTPVLFVTGCADDKDFLKHIDAGGSAYVTKPVDRRRLLSKVNELLVP